MLVSAISSNTMVRALNTKGNDQTGDTAFGFLTSYAKRNSVDKDMCKLYDSIYEWKNFCHKQIENGKLNIIA